MRLGIRDLGYKRFEIWDMGNEHVYFFPESPKEQRIFIRKIYKEKRILILL